MEIETQYTSKDPKASTEDQTNTSTITLDIILKDLAAGSLAGVANVISGHPFDTIKVRMQMIDTKLFACIRSIVSKEGLASFYKGVYSPLYSVPAINAVVFGAYETARRTLMRGSDSEMTIYQGMLAGSWAGLLNCLVVTPVELIKCRQQMEGMGCKGRTTKSLTMLKQIVRNEGVRGLYKGNLITIMREMPAYAAQFGSYEITKNFLTSKYGESQVLNFCAGAFAGFMCWVASYPQDVIKTNLQCGKIYSSHRFIKDGGIISCARDIYKREGVRGFWRGFSACTMRAAIANAFTFVAYEEAKKLFI